MFEFVPTISGAYVITIELIPIELRYWRKECPIFIPNLLMSFGITLTERNRLLTPELYGIESYNNLFLDSGGFQIAERKINIDASDVYKWYLRICDVVDTKSITAFPLDYPLTSEVTSMDDVISRASRTYENTLKLLKYRDKFKVYAVLHGIGRLDIIEKWWNIAVEPVLNDVDGVATAIRPITDLNAYAITACYLISKGVKVIHTFFGTGKKFMMLGTYLSSFVDKITFDASRFSKAVGKGARLLLHNLEEIRIGRAGKRRNLTYNNITCNCPTCNSVLKGDLSVALNLRTVKDYVLLSLHNLCALVQYKNYVQQLYNLKRKTFMKKFRKTKINVDFIDDAISLGFEKAYAKHYGGGLRKWL